LEHIGKQGDFKGFFEEFSEYHRILKSGGLMIITVPAGDGIFSDPGHTRVLTPVVFSFLCQDFYKKAIGKSCMTDYRWCWNKNFNIIKAEKLENESWYVVLQKV